MSFLNVEKRIEKVKKDFHQSDDFASRVLVKQNAKIGFMFFKSITDGELFAETIYKPLSSATGEITLESLQNKVLKSSDIKEIKEDEIVENIISGSIIILVEGEEKVIAVDLLKYLTRTPTEPPTSPVIMGPREGFTEDINTNISLMRRRIASKDLVMKQVKIGSYSNTRVMITYVHGIVDQKIVEKVTQRLKEIKIDGILDAYYLVGFLQEDENSMFRQVGMAEKPDIVSSKLLEGKVGILVDNSPIVLTVPFILFEDLQNSNDYYSNHHYSSFIRAVRLIGIIMAILASGVYLALQIYHYNIVPLNFLITIADTTQGLPFTPYIEILFIFLLFQILYEVSLRLPTYLGLATSVVGALILGDTGVKAGLISPPGVIIVAVSKIALYLVPQQSSQVCLLQLVFLFLGGSLGMLGIIGGMIYFTNYLNKIDSYGVPYLAPYSPRIKNDLQDGIFKENIGDMRKRPESFNNKNKVRLK